jgi:ankyrin repeat protein
MYEFFSGFIYTFLQFKVRVSTADDVEQAEPAVEKPVTEEGETSCFECPILLNTYANNGKTPIMVASSLGSVESVKLLLKSGRVDVNQPQSVSSVNELLTPRSRCSGALLEAVTKGHIAVVHLLQDSGATDYENLALSAAVQASLYIFEVKQNVFRRQTRK